MFNINYMSVFLNLTFKIKQISYYKSFLKQIPTY